MTTTFEDRCKAHYEKVGARLNKYPAKKPIAVVNTGAKLTKRIGLPDHEEYSHIDITRIQKRKVMDHVIFVRTMWENHASAGEIAIELGFLPAAISKFIKRQGWKRA